MTLIGDEVILTTKGDLGGIVIFYVIGWNIEFIDSRHSRPGRNSRLFPLIRPSKSSP
jgi:hypothetical protein